MHGREEEDRQEEDHSEVSREEASGIPQEEVGSRFALYL